MPSSSETFTQFIQGAPVALQANTSDLIPIIQGGVTKGIPAAQAIGAASPTLLTTGLSYSVLTTDTFLAIAKSSPNTVHLTSGPTFNQRLTVADCGGNAGSNPITIVPGAGDTIDGIGAFVLLSNWQSVNLQYIQALNLWKSF